MTEKATLTEAEISQLKEGLKRTYKDRFLFCTMLYKTQLTMQKAKITHKSSIAK
ncbi:hypothetical protein INP83_16195 [Mucilaginibacter sp. 21P]|uniref:hypothetical protein n=1 Tax=Mucilaginibacter TaxID=423349 RepID=UPI001644A048|nr:MULTISPECIES: hypothetical protein [Mucilaginibacter]QXV64619.1 hypothetical protein INP83_16195 [Mucilaginibacter sp. 21P]